MLGCSGEGGRTLGQSSLPECWAGGVWQWVPLPDSEALVSAEVWKGWKMMGSFRTALLDQFSKPRGDKSFPWLLQGCP